jgi:RNA polymerase sigma-B factor
MAVAPSSTVERARLIEQYLPLVVSVARRFSGRGERQEDLAQVAALALVRAVDRRDPRRVAVLPAYISRCVEGEVLRHLRDRTSAVRVPRSLQTREGRDALDDSALATLASARTPALLDLDASLAGPTRLDEVTTARAMAAQAVKRLDERERQIVLLRFYHDYTQAEVGQALGISQAHVSRLLGGACAKMREGLEPPSALSRMGASARVEHGDGTRAAAAPRA